MKEIKICKNIKDFNWMKNGSGLDLLVEDEDHIEIWYEKSTMVYTAKINEIDLLKSMGFQFEYKPRLPLREILKKYEDKNFEKNGENYYLYYDEEQKVYDCLSTSTKNYIGVKYYDFETIDKIINELNE